MLKTAALILLLLAAQTGNALAQAGWYVRVCPARTQTPVINLSFTGDGQLANLSWVNGRSPPTLGLPPPFDLVRRLHISAHATPAPGNDHPRADLCIGYRDHIVKQMSFTGSEDHDQSVTDTDACGC